MEQSREDAEVKVMDRSQVIRMKLEQIEKLVAEIKNELEGPPTVGGTQVKKPGSEEPLPPEEELRGQYDKLYDGFAAGKQGLIEEFVESKSMRYLRAFCKANSLPVDTTKVGKKGIAKELMQWMVQREALTRRVT
jgi:hypothetical protein